jgi:hypothetical protein
MRIFSGIQTVTLGLAVSASSYFNNQTPVGLVQGIPHHCCNILQYDDGYSYYLVA